MVSKSIDHDIVIRARGIDSNLPATEHTPGEVGRDSGRRGACEQRTPIASGYCSGGGHRMNPPAPCPRLLWIMFSVCSLPAGRGGGGATAKAERGRGKAAGAVVLLLAKVFFTGRLTVGGSRGARSPEGHTIEYDGNDCN